MVGVRTVYSAELFSLEMKGTPGFEGPPHYPVLILKIGFGPASQVEREPFGVIFPDCDVIKMGQALVGMKEANQLLVSIKITGAVVAAYNNGVNGNHTLYNVFGGGAS